MSVGDAQAVIDAHIIWNFISGVRRRCGPIHHNVH